MKSIGDNGVQVFEGLLASLLIRFSCRTRSKGSQTSVQASRSSESIERSSRNCSLRSNYGVWKGIHASASDSCALPPPKDVFLVPGPVAFRDSAAKDQSNRTRSPFFCGRPPMTAASRCQSVSSSRFCGRSIKWTVTQSLRMVPAALFRVSRE